MRKRFLSLVLAVVMVLSLNVAAFADEPGGGGKGDPTCGPEPISIPIQLPCNIGCPEDDQGQDDDCDPQP